MLREIEPVAQDQDGRFRRWFEDDVFDLIVWYDERQEISGFQLCYEKSRDEHALTWLADRGYAHHRVDTGEQSVWETKAPVLIADEVFPRQQVMESFRERSGGIDLKVAQYVVQKIEAYR